MTSQKNDTPDLNKKIDELAAHYDSRLAEIECRIEFLAATLNTLKSKGGGGLN